jgi:glyoxylase-like metal-dependent hydrolase (beta-lactamase superfamily II)
MQQGVPPGASSITELDAAWSIGSPGPRLRALRTAAEKLRDRFAAGPRAVAVRTLPIIFSPYPTKHAFFGAAISPAPFVVFTHRCAVVQFLQRGELKTLLFNPTDVPGARSTPYFERLAAGVPERLQKVIAKEFAPLPEQLAELGIRAEDVDYVAYDHLHVQDLRPIVGTEDGRIPARYPKATVLVPKVEWDDWDDLHPMQRAWFVRDGKLGVKKDRIVLTTGDLALGDGVMLLRTPGHTSGNQTLFLSTASGVWGISENGTCADNWSPMDSRIPGLRAFCRRQDVDVVLNANTPERGADQYTSMVLERTVVDRVARAPGFVQMFPSSEVTPSPLSPGLRPTILHRAIEHGSLVPTAPSARPAATVASPSGRVRTWASPS